MPFFTSLYFLGTFCYFQTACAKICKSLGGIFRKAGRSFLTQEFYYQVRVTDPKVGFLSHVRISPSAAEPVQVCFLQKSAASIVAEIEHWLQLHEGAPFASISNAAQDRFCDVGW